MVSLNDAKTPTITKEGRLKFMVYGTHGTGKSHFACSFPNTFYIDAEDRVSKLPIYQKLLTDSSGKFVVTNKIGEIIDYVKLLINEKHQYKTLVIDSLTVAYDQAVADAEERLTSAHGKHIYAADKEFLKLISLLLDKRFDMNVIVLCWMKTEYAPDRSVMGNTYKCYKYIGHIFDLVLENSVLNGVYTATVKKSRLEGFKNNSKINFSYEDIKKRCSAEIEKEAEPASIATTAEVKELAKLIELTDTPREVVLGMLKKANVKDFDEMSQQAIQKCIKFLTKQLTASESKQDGV